MPQSRTHVALIVPASNSVMEPDVHREAGPGVVVSTWRIFLESVTREAEERMLAEELPRCLDQMRHARPDLVVFGCTSAGSLDGLARDNAVSARIVDATGAEVVTVVASMLSALEAAGAARVAVFTPYIEELTASVAGCVSEAGHGVVKDQGMGILDNRAIGAVEPEAIVRFVRRGMDGVDADALFLSCTNWRAMEAIEPLSAELGLPVLSSNQVTLAEVERVVAGTPAAPASIQ